MYRVVDALPHRLAFERVDETRATKVIKPGGVQVSTYMKEVRR